MTEHELEVVAARWRDCSQAKAFTGIGYDEIIAWLPDSSLAKLYVMSAQEVLNAFPELYALAMKQIKHETKE